jgi:hypothetical protein
MRNRVFFVIIITLYTVNLVLTMRSGRELNVVSTMCLVLSIAAALLSLIYIRQALRSPRLQFPLNLWLPYGISLFLLGSIYYQKNTYTGGDVDPIAFLEEKTDQHGGYVLLTDKTTYRERIISKEDFFAHPLSKYKLLDGVSSLTRVRDYPISVPLDVPGRSFRVTMSLVGAVIHLPFDEQRVRKFFADHGQEKGFVTNPDYLIARHLTTIAAPIFRSMTYAPANGYFKIDLDTTKGVFESLEEYGFTIVQLPNQDASLVFKVEDRDENEGGPLFKNYSYRASEIPKIFGRTNQ